MTRRMMALGVAALLLGVSPAAARPDPPVGDPQQTAPQQPAPVVGHRITGHTRHGLHQAIGRDDGRGVSPKAMLDAARNPQTTIQGVDALGRPFLRYQGRDAAVVTRPNGQIITTIPRNEAGVRNPAAGRRR
ncbi:hypothetical protein [Teichococcus aestuarii]|uniref:Antifreeze protein n=1 Tax=Teichococcus aestuarii TaxID=568898 RepID=A0A2U1UY50_9PROT|nr:hypothetical protein [Pseudoroseomonas aestuarii]PWC26585.1 hypothetical protein CR165_22340 [Pseudoroseomonas aestuarii]